MADNTHIEWTDATWNPVTGCTLVSAGCTNCYAARLAATRLRNHPSRAGLARLNAAGVAKFTGEVRFNEQWIDQPLRWRRPRRVFVCAHGDLFHEDVPDEWIDRVFAVMALAPQHTFQVLTKRPERMREYIERIERVSSEEECDPTTYLFSRALDVRHWRKTKTVRPDWPLPNVWLGTSAEDQATADARIPHLLATPAAVRFVSAEPLLGPLDLTKVGNLESCRSAFPSVVADEVRHMAPHVINGFQIDALGKPYQSTAYYQTPDHMGGFAIFGTRRWPRLDWVIAGGESGPGARPMEVAWAESLRDQCADAGVAFFMKQMAKKAPIPDQLMVREDPYAR